MTSTHIPQKAEYWKEIIYSNLIKFGETVTFKRYQAELLKLSDELKKKKITLISCRKSNQVGDIRLELGTFPNFSW